MSTKQGEILHMGRDTYDVRVDDVQLGGQAMESVDEFSSPGNLKVSEGKITNGIDRRRAGATISFIMLWSSL